jgi:serine phosphatase RsbU (regulator of sigma subunit)
LRAATKGSGPCRLNNRSLWSRLAWHILFDFRARRHEVSGKLGDKRIRLLSVSATGHTNAVSRRAPNQLWILIWLALGAGLAVLLLVDSISTYIFVSRAIVIDRARRELTRVSAEVEHKMQTQHPRTEAEIKALLTSIEEEHEHLLWLDLNWPDGSRPEVRTTEHPNVSFAGIDIGSRLRDHLEITTVTPTRTGQAVVGLYMIHALVGPHGMRPMEMGSTPPPPEALSHRMAHELFPTLQVAMSTSAMSAEFWPIRRNLIIDCSAAVALLAASLLAFLRLRSYVRAKELEQQLKIARQVQQSLLLSGTSTSRHVQVAAECIPAWHVGGDFYDSFRAPGDDFALVLGDVSGKGVPAALLAGLIHGAVRSSNWTASAEQHEQACRRLNELLLERASGERYATMFWGYYDPASRRLRYINAGHCPPLLLHQGGNGVEVTRLEEGGTVVGLLPAARYRQASVPIEPGDTLVVYSDGIAEANNPREEEFGEERLLEVIRFNWSASVEEIRSKVLEAVREFAAGTPAADDLTLLIARFEGTIAETGNQAAEEQLAAT